MIDNSSVGIAQASSRFTLPAGFKPSYGTAGFRAEASLLESTLFRVGLLTAARSLTLKQHCGIMITASHNPEHDNGVKIVEPSGEMLTQVCGSGPVDQALLQCVWKVG
jgi:phosphoacetylglucosamine mutase